jgi:hypothetical protein
VEVIPISGVMNGQSTSLVLRVLTPLLRKLVFHSGAVDPPSASKA